MVTGKRKVRRLRGSRTHGWGQVGQHRKSGRKGGRGQAGLHKHKWTWTVKYDKEHFGKNVWAPPNRVEVSSWVNVGNLEELYYRYGTVGSSTDELPVLDLARLGYMKLLGGGSASRALKVLVKEFTSSAKEKIERAGGVLVKE